MIHICKIKDIYFEIKCTYHKLKNSKFIQKRIKWIKIKRIELILTLALIILTFFLIKSTNESNKLNKNFQIFQRRNEINERINLAKDLLDEFKINNITLDFLANNKFDRSNPIEYIAARIKTDEIEKALDTTGFGSENMRLNLKIYLHNFGLINDKLDQLFLATQKENNERIKESRDQAYERAKEIMYGNMPYTKFMEQINYYIEEQEKLLREVDSCLTEELILKC